MIDWGMPWCGVCPTMAARGVGFIGESQRLAYPLHGVSSSRAPLPVPSLAFIPTLKLLS